MTPRSRLALSFSPALLCLPLLSACGPEIRGSPEPPKEFGAVQGKLLGCPAMQGLYAWPPVQGEYAQSIPTNRTPWDGGRPVPIYRGKMQIKVEQNSLRLTIRSRSIRPNSVRSSEARDWAYVEYDSAQYACKGGMLVFEEVPYSDARNYGGTSAKRGFTLALMKDGSLAVGIKTTTTGHIGSYFTWGGQSYGTYNAPDLVIWSWSKLGALDAASN